MVNDYFIISVSFLVLIYSLFISRIRSHLWLLPAWFFPYKKARTFFHKLRGVDIGKGVEIGYMVDIDNRYPERIHIGDNVTIVSQSMILAHDNSYRYSRNGEIKISDVFIGKNVFVGGNSVILPGVKIGNSAIVGAGSVVTRDVKAETVVVGHRAREIGKNS